MTMLRRLAPRLVVGTLLLSCGDDGGAGSATDFIASYCGFLQPCCAMAKLKSDGQQCRTLLGGLAPAMYNAAAGEACLTELRAASARADYCTGGMEAATSCDKAFPETAGGTKKPGETCTQDDECAPSTEGRVECQRLSSGGAQIRKCQVQVTGKAGDQPCVGTVEGNATSYVPGSGNDIPARAYLCRVADGLYCDFDTNVCTSFKALGEECGSFNDCGRSAFCDPGTRKCVARKAIGETCSGGFANREECVPGAFCQAMSMTCAAQLGDGVACTESDQCKSLDCVNGSCKGDAVVNFALALLCGGT